MAKPLRDSKTAVLNLIAMASAIGLMFGVDLELTPEMQTALAGGYVVLVHLGNILLRAITNSPISGMWKR
jgi:hypothetical protein